jgi:hypothetical protein
MAFKIDELLSQKSRDMILKTQDEMLRIFSLQSRFLGRALLQLSRDVRKADPERFGQPVDSYEKRILWTVLPGLAAHLGEDGLDADERLAVRDLPVDRAEMRTYVGHLMNNSRFERTLEEFENEKLRLLSNEIVNGNPITVGLDRVAPPLDTDMDWPAKYTREISRVRFGDERFTGWAPEMQDYKGLEDPFSGSALDNPIDDDDLQPG